MAYTAMHSAAIGVQQAPACLISARSRCCAGQGRPAVGVRPVFRSSSVGVLRGGRNLARPVVVQHAVANSSAGAAKQPSAATSGASTVTLGPITVGKFEFKTLLLPAMLTLAITKVLDGKGLLLAGYLVARFSPPLAALWFGKKVHQRWGLRLAAGWLLAALALHHLEWRTLWAAMTDVPLTLQYPLAAFDLAIPAPVYFWILQHKSVADTAIRMAAYGGRAMVTVGLAVTLLRSAARLPLQPFAAAVQSQQATLKLAVALATYVGPAIYLLRTGKIWLAMVWLFTSPSVIIPCIEGSSKHFAKAHAKMSSGAGSNAAATGAVRTLTSDSTGAQAGEHKDVAAETVLKVESVELFAPASELVQAEAEEPPANDPVQAELEWLRERVDALETDERLTQLEERVLLKHADSMVWKLDNYKVNERLEAVEEAVSSIGEQSDDSEEEEGDVQAQLDELRDRLEIIETEAERHKEAEQEIIADSGFSGVLTELEDLRERVEELEAAAEDESDDESDEEDEEDASDEEAVDLGDIQAELEELRERVYALEEESDEDTESDEDEDDDIQAELEDLRERVEALEEDDSDEETESDEDDDSIQAEVEDLRWRLEALEKAAEEETESNQDDELIQDELEALRERVVALEAAAEDDSDDEEQSDNEELEDVKYELDEVTTRVQAVEDTTDEVKELCGLLRERLEGLEERTGAGGDGDDKLVHQGELRELRKQLEEAVAVAGQGAAAQAALAARVAALEGGLAAAQLARESAEVQLAAAGTPAGAARKPAPGTRAPAPAALGDWAKLMEMYGPPGGAGAPKAGPDGGDRTDAAAAATKALVDVGRAAAKAMEEVGLEGQKRQNAAVMKGTVLDDKSLRQLADRFANRWSSKGEPVDVVIKRRTRGGEPTMQSAAPSAAPSPPAAAQEVPVEAPAPADNAAAAAAGSAAREVPVEVAPYAGLQFMGARKLLRSHAQRARAAAERAQPAGGKPASGQVDVEVAPGAEAQRAPVRVEVQGTGWPASAAEDQAGTSGGSKTAGSAAGQQQATHSSTYDSFLQALLADGSRAAAKGKPVGVEQAAKGGTDITVEAAEEVPVAFGGAAAKVEAGQVDVAIQTEGGHRVEAAPGSPVARAEREELKVSKSDSIKVTDGSAGGGGANAEEVPVEVLGDSGGWRRAHSMQAAQKAIRDAQAAAAMASIEARKAGQQAAKAAGRRANGYRFVLGDGPMLRSRSLDDE